ncbi:hypothetical protein AV530_012765 [Patagioenas fasciata monilis]|uniref:FERM domain-containing protein n=1 Tax=Patagioenas fasciata monilis TaxID=372326 RepID=A0A1V4K378_PATFA|nr:hypothetical protein AV530_012765 [Patagioenas fasciata monilis]
MATLDSEMVSSSQGQACSWGILKDFLPKEYIKQKGECKIFMAHKNCRNMSKIEAKVHYMKLACSLKTYGVKLCRKREKITLDWRGMRSPPCWKTLSPKK